MKAVPVVPAKEWEWMWAPYDGPTYAAVLEHIAPNDVVLEIGAGDFRLARQVAHRAQRVYAIERNTALLESLEPDLPANCQVIAGDGRWLPFPEEVTVTVLLMRHCTHLRWYWTKLKATNCSRLITNARWGMDVEVIDLNGPRIAYKTLSMGWFACYCGSAGFVPGQAEFLTEIVMNTTWEVNECPACRSQFYH